MRQIFLDTETTGLDPKLGHRLIEVAGVEMINRRRTKQHFHRYVNPEREIDARALEVHGITLDFLQDKPKFAAIAADLVEFVRGAELIIHNADFDIGFLDHELARLDLPPITSACARVVDTLKLARELHPGKRNNLDALCERYLISNSHRHLHGALLDAELLAEVYLAMTRGQETLDIASVAPPVRRDSSGEAIVRRGPLSRIALSEEELAAHARVLANIDRDSKGACLWRTAPEPAAP